MRSYFLELLKKEMEKAPELARKMKSLADSSLIKINSAENAAFPIFKDSELMADDILKMQDMDNKKDYLLFHSTAKKNKKDIERLGLQPNVGEIVKEVYGTSLEPMIFFDSNPSSYYGVWQNKGSYRPSYDKIKVNDIANKAHHFTTTAGNESIYLNNLVGYNPIQPVTKEKLNIHIDDFLSKYPQVENSDYFSLEEVNPKHSIGGLSGLEIEMKKSPMRNLRLGSERGVDMLKLKDLPSPEYQVELIKKLAKNPNYAVAPVAGFGNYLNETVEINPVKTLSNVYNSYKDAQEEFVSPAVEKFVDYSMMGQKDSAQANVVKSLGTEALDPLNYLEGIPGAIMTLLNLQK